MHALGMHGKCTAVKASKVGSMTIAAADWGTARDGIGVTTYRGISKSTLKTQFVGRTGSVVRLGSFSRERTVLAGIALTAWVRGVGVLVDLRHLSTTAKNKAYRARVLALGRAVAKQI